MSSLYDLAKTQYLSNYMPYVESNSKPPKSLLSGSNAASGLTDMFKSLPSVSFPSLYGTSSASFSYESKEYADGLKDTLSSLTTKGKGSVFNLVEAGSSNTGALSVSFSGSSAPASSYSVGVSALAQSQQNTGSGLASDGYDLSPGTYQIGLNVGGKDYSVSFEIKDGDDNEAAQRRIADAINSRNIGVTAEVSSENGSSSLVLTGSKTGAAARFTVSDQYSSNGTSTVSALGMNNVSRLSSDASYTVNGSKRTASSNTVSIGSGIEVTFEKTTSSDVDISFKNNRSSATDAVKEMVDGYNSLFSSGNGILQNKMASLSNTYRRSLSEIGITSNYNGTLSVDSTQLSKAAGNGKLEAFFGQSNSPVASSSRASGFAGGLQQLASSVSQSPNQYAYGNRSTENFMSQMFSSLNSNSTLSLFI